MSKTIKDALSVSGMDSLLRDLNLSFQTSRLQLVKFNQFLKSLAHTARDDQLMEMINAVVVKMDAGLVRISTMGRKWEDALDSLHEVEVAMDSLEIYIASSMSESDATHLLYQIRSMDLNFGIKHVTRTILEDMKGNTSSIKYLIGIFQLLSDSRYFNEEIRETLDYLIGLEGAIRKLKKENVTIQDLVSYAKIMRYVHEKINRDYDELMGL